MTKVTLNDLVNLENQTSAVNTINTNNAVIETAFDNTLSRDGTSPNTMSASLDMNSNQIINLPAPSTVNSPARLLDVVSNPTIVVPGTGTSGHVVPFLDGNNTWSGTNTHSASETFNSTSTFNGVANFIAPPTGVISSVGSGAGLTGGPITSSGTLSLDVNGLTIKTAPDQYADTLPIYDAAGTSVKKIRVRPPRGHIWGLTISNDVSTPNTVIDITAGEASSDSTSPLMMVSAAFTKNCNAAWAVGSGNGALDTGSLTLSTGYHIWQIMRSDTGVVDFLISTSATAPTMPTNYDHKRRIGWILTDSSTHILLFKQYENSFYWGTAILDASALAITANVDTLVTLTVPVGVRVSPLISLINQTASLTSGYNIRSPDLQSSMNVNSSSGDFATFFSVIASTPLNKSGGGDWQAYTNTSGQITLNTAVNGTINLRTLGWIDTRGRLS